MRLPLQLFAILATSSTFASLLFGDNFVADMFSTGPIQYVAAEHPSLRQTVTFTLSNLQAYSIEIDVLKEPEMRLPTKDEWAARGDLDRFDTIINLSRTGGTCGVGTILNPAGARDSTCTYQIRLPSLCTTKEISVIRTATMECG
jgi:hypothetical protein